MKHTAVFLQVVWAWTALVVGIVLPTLLSGYRRRVTASIPGEGLSPHQRSLEKELRAGIEARARTLDPVIVTFNRTVRFSSRTAPSHVTFSGFQGSYIIQGSGLLGG